MIHKNSAEVNVIGIFLFIYQIRSLWMIETGNTKNNCMIINSKDLPSRYDNCYKTYLVIYGMPRRTLGVIVTSL